MGNYIDGFVFPIQAGHLKAYRQVATAVAEIWQQHGALEYCEFVADDLCLQGTRSFVDLMAAKEGETIVFGWVAFESKAVRDVANQKVAADPRMTALVEPLCQSSNPVFDAKRMSYGGFCPLVQSVKLDTD